MKCGRFGSPRTAGPWSSLPARVWSCTGSGGREAAAEWARSHVCAVHPDTGSSQVYRRIDPDMLVGEDAHPRTQRRASPRSLTDSQVRRLGVPPDQIDFVRLALDKR